MRYTRRLLALFTVAVAGAGAVQWMQAPVAWAASTPSREVPADVVFLNGHALLHSAHVVSHATTYFPETDVMTVLANLNVPHHYEHFRLSVDGAYTTSAEQVGTVFYLPIWYVMQALHRIGDESQWNGHAWSIQAKLPVLHGPSASAVHAVMASTSEIQDTGEDFSETSKPILTPDGQGGTLSAVVGTRNPTADGLGQILFFFHNNTWVGLNSHAEATQIKSVIPDGAEAFQVTYVNYASNDPMYAPNLPPVTVIYRWEKGRMVPSRELPKGVLNGLTVHTVGTPAK
ncbi:LppP/LprE family lipoprotein [Alicyclobacillus sp. SP_1]|jgi:hypothetical protein|uniref:LppP/LprE family lipoprotein n=1 Tax=Alicyclobacillus sp. SP_1 TaxID=2942475 RepID=UPI0021579AAD|nr:LppP/LprE family lipoprotein [Alicyclobacillus sp. SP_1]